MSTTRRARRLRHEISEKGLLFQGNNLRLNFLKQLGRFDEVATASSPMRAGRGARSSAT